MFAGAVVANGVHADHADEVFADADLDGAGDDGDLDLAAPVGVATREFVPAKDTLPDESTWWM